MQLLKDFIKLFYPKLCVVCEKHLVANEHLVCVACRHDLPVIYYNDSLKNKITTIFYGRIPVEKANTLLSFTKEGKTKQLIHELKYKGNQSVGAFIGNWLGEILLENGHFSDIDFIVPVPLHKNKLKKRGYNQVTKFGERLSAYLKTPFKEDLLIRTSSTKTQTYKRRFERFDNLDTKFSLMDPSFFENKHLLLIDDIITTGATLEACAKELLKSKNVRISILTMAFTT